MDRRVKERLIGASILVAIAVLVVPEMLSGQKAAPPPVARLPATAPESAVRNVTVDLATAKAPVNLDEPAAATAPPAARAAEPPSAAPSVAPTSAPTPAVRVENASPSPISTARAWAVQLGSFQSSDNAEKLLRQMKAQGFSAYVSASGSGVAQRYRVRIGPMADREAAERMAAKLKALGQGSSIVRPAA